MFFFGKKKLRRVQPDKSKVVSQTEDQAATREWFTYILVGILFSLIIISTLGFGYLRSAEHILSVTIVSTLAVFLMIFALWILHPKLFSSPIKLFFFGVISVSLVALVEVFLRFGWPLYLLPVVLTSMIITIGYSQQLAVINLFFQIFVIWLLIDDKHFAKVIIHFPAAMLVILGLTELRTRSKLIRLGALAGVVTLLMVLMKIVFLDVGLQEFFNNIRVQPFENSWTKKLILSFINGLVSGFIVLGILPFIEKWFGVLTDLSLLELTDMNQPLLRKLSLEAPGTYHHSLRVGNLAEAAARAIRANSLLVRVGAYFHDIGKLNKPEYFVENEVEANSKHKNLSPMMSTLVITAHVKDGLEFAKYHRLPSRIFDFVEQHHGNSVVKYFYHEAKEKNNHNDNEDRVAPESFRYSGPKPQTKETAIVLLADSVEAASRALSSVTPAKLKGLVHDIIMSKLLDGQLDQSNITMSELKTIENTFTRGLAGVFHARIKYPEENGQAETNHKKSKSESA